MISLIAAIGGDNPERARNFRVFLDCAVNQHFCDHEIIIVELIYEDRSYFQGLVEGTDEQIIYVAVPAEEWNRSWGYNVGARMSHGETLVFMDADVIFPSKYLNAVDALFQTPYALGWSNSLWLNERGTKTIVDGPKRLGPDLIERFLFASSDPCSCKGLSNIFNREFFFNTLGGYHEAFKGWGAEDCEMIFRAKATTDKWHVLPQTLIHLCHGERIPGEDNQSIFKNTQHDPLAVCEYLKEEGLGDLGGPNTTRRSSHDC